MAYVFAALLRPASETDYLARTTVITVASHSTHLRHPQHVKRVNVDTDV